MKFGVHLLAQYSPEQKSTPFLDEVINQAKTAEKSGFDSVFVSEHHPNASGWIPPLMLLAALARETNKVLLGTNIVLLPLYHPVHVYEDVTSLDIFSNGRIILGVAIGFFPEDFESFGISLRERVGRFEEGLDIVRRLGKDDVVTYEGKYFRCNHISRVMKPVGKLPIWIGAEVAPAIKRAARLGDAWIPADTSSIRLLKKDFELYKQALKEAGKDFETLEKPLMRESFVANDAETAQKKAGPIKLEKYRWYWEGGAPQLRAEFANSNFTFDELKKDRFVVGDPDDCIEAIEKHVNELKVNHLIFRIQNLGMPHRDVVESIKLFGEKVIPYFRER